MNSSNFTIIIFLIFSLLNLTECATSKGKEKIGEGTEEYELGRRRVGQRPPPIHLSNEDLIKANLEAENGKEMKEHIKMWPNKGTNFMRASGLIESKAVEHQSGQVGETSSKGQTEHGESSGTEISKFERMIEENQGLNEEEMEEQLKALPVHNFDNFMKRKIHSKDTQDSKKGLRKRINLQNKKENSGNGENDGGKKGGDKENDLHKKKDN